MKKKDQMKWRIYVESIRYFEMKKASRVRGWVPGNTKICPVLVWRSKTLRYRNRDRILASRQNSFLGSNCEWNRQIRNRNGKTISLENVEHRVIGKSVATAKPRPMPTLTLSPISIPVRERNWIDSNPERFRPDCFPVSKAMIRSLRHDPSIPRGDDGVARIDDIMEKSTAKFDGTSQWPITDSTLTRDRRARGEEQEVFRGEPDGLYSPTQLQDDSNTGWWCGSCEWFLVYYAWFQRVKLYMSKEESFPIPLKHIDVTRTTHTSLDILLEKVLMITGT